MDDLQVQVALFGNCLEQSSPFFLLNRQPVFPSVLCLCVLFLADWRRRLCGKIHKVWHKMLRQLIENGVRMERDELVTANPKISSVFKNLTKLDTVFLAPTKKALLWESEAALKVCYVSFKIAWSRNMKFERETRPGVVKAKPKGWFKYSLWTTITNWNYWRRRRFFSVFPSR